MPVTLRVAAPGELAWINERYRSIDFRLSAPDDFQVVAEVDGKPAGLGRIVPIEGRVGELGGMLVFDAYRGTGLSKAIIGFLAETTRFDFLYCLPFANLESLVRGVRVSASRRGRRRPGQSAGEIPMVRDVLHRAGAVDGPLVDQRAAISRRAAVVVMAAYSPSRLARAIA